MLSDCSNLYLRGFTHPLYSSYNPNLMINFDKVLNWVSELHFLDKIVIDSTNDLYIIYTFTKDNFVISKSISIEELKKTSDFAFVILSLQDSLDLLLERINLNAE